MTELDRLVILWMGKTGGTKEDAINWALDIMAEDAKICEEIDVSEGPYVPLRDYLEELEKRLL